MPSISAVDAISPAIRRTREFLFRSTRWTTYLKLCLVAIITEGFGGNFSVSWPGGGTSGHKHALLASSHLTPGLISAIVAASLLGMVLMIALFYLITRLRFAYFYCLVRNTREIRPGWRLYRSQAIRFFWLNVAVGFCFLGAIALIAVPFVVGFWRLSHNSLPGGHVDVGLLLLLILPLIPIVLLLIFLGIAVELILRDWMMPHFALENATSREAWLEAWKRIKAEKGAFFAYALLRIILPIVAAIALLIAVVISALILAAIVALFWFGLHRGFAGATGGALIAVRLIAASLIAIAFIAVLFLLLCLFGPLSTAVREYALVFYGGRYQRLGELLSPPPDAGLSPNGIA